jgi:hypothetical protein
MTGVVGIDYDKEGLQRLRELAEHTVLLTPNHPTTTEPMLTFLLSCTVGQFFYYLTAREVFEQMGGVQGWVIQRLGSYSIVRGAIDRNSFRVTRELLAQKGTKLVIFPEGEVYLQTETVLPFQSGVFQMAFWGLEDARKAGRENDPFYLVPTAFRYKMARDISGEIEASLLRLEKATGSDVQPGDDTYTRLRRVSIATLRTLEKEYGIKSPKEEDFHADLTERMDAIKETLLTRVAMAAGLSQPKGQTLVDRMRSLHTQVEAIARADSEATTPFEIALQEQRQKRTRPLITDLYRLSNWIAAYDGYVREAPTQERIADTLIRLEKECFGSATLRPPRRAQVRIGEPLDIATHWEAYQANKKEAIQNVTTEMERRVATLVGATTVPAELFA